MLSYAGLTWYVLRALRTSLKTNEAIENYKKAIKAKPDFADAYNNLGTLFSDVARFDESMLNYKKAIELYKKSSNQGFAEAKYNLGVMYDKVNYFQYSI